MAAMQHEFMIRINNRIVIRAVEFRFDLATKIGQCIGKHADDMPASVFSRRDCAHADLVLIVALRRAGEDACRHRQLQCFCGAC